MTGAAIINAENICARAFAPFGNLMRANGDATIINNGYAKRYAARAEINAAADGKARVHFFAPRARITPLPVTIMERHPRGAQCFVPMGGEQWLALVAEDGDNKPANPRAFNIGGDSGLQYGKNIWHCPLLSLSAQHFAVADNGYGADDLQLHLLKEPVWLNAETQNGNDAIFANNPAQMSEDEFMRHFANIAEESPWVAEAVWQNGGATACAKQLANAFALAILKADENKQTQLVQNHPRLGVEKLESLSAHSQNEQSRAGLATLDAKTKASFAELNKSYENKFGIPFICAVAGMRAPDILAQLKLRLENEAVVERAEALYQTFVIIARRLDAMAQNK